ncbi:serine protease 56 [Ambystoma mexicanum]|uniref:serine protease 56 n=1 Tax=Ambystoma mexicanum TaxID=8296 RepID=UPI0037E8ACDA
MGPGCACAAILILLLAAGQSCSAPLAKDLYLMPAGVLRALSSRGTLVLEAALKSALESMEGALEQRNRWLKACRGCAPCLFQDCGSTTTECAVPDPAQALEPSCKEVLETQRIPEQSRRNWALSKACSHYQRLCPEGNPTAESCIQLMAGNCKLRLQECRLENDMDYLNTATEEESGTCGRRLEPANATVVKGKIVGGTAAGPGAWPWLVSIRLNGELMCGGVLVGRTWVLTAAHCFTGTNNELYWTVVVGDYDLSKPDEGEKVLAVNRIIVHPKFNQKTFNNDLALVELTAPATHLEKTSPVCLPEAPQDPAAGTPCFIAGWGSVYQDGPSADVVMEARVPVLSQESCRNALGKDLLTNTMFCAGYLSGGIDSCQGDSGGPLTCQDPVSKLYVLHGITSWGDGCGERGKPGVYTRVTAFTDWVLHQMSKSPLTREPTCHELGTLSKLSEKDQRSEFSRLCSFYTQSCTPRLSKAACTRAAEETCRAKQKKCELRSYLQGLLDLLRLAEDFLRNNVDFSFFTQTLPQFMEQMYKQTFSPRVRRDLTEMVTEEASARDATQAPAEATRLPGKATPPPTAGGPTGAGSKPMEHPERLSKELSFESLFQGVGPHLEDWVTHLRGLASLATGPNVVTSTSGKGGLAAEMELFKQGDESSVEELKGQGWLYIQRLMLGLASQALDQDIGHLEMPAVEQLEILMLNESETLSRPSRRQARDVTGTIAERRADSRACRALNESQANVAALREQCKWILRAPESKLSMAFQEILVDLGSKNEKGLFRARVQATVGGKAITFNSLIGLEKASLDRSMPGLIALALGALKT